MNTNFQIAYLTGGDDVFGPELRRRHGLHQRRARATRRSARTSASCCRTSVHPADGERGHGRILDDGKEPEEAATAWLKANPAALDAWLAGVTTFDGGDGLAAVKGIWASEARPTPAPRHRDARLRRERAWTG